MCESESHLAWTQIIFFRDVKINIQISVQFQNAFVKASQFHTCWYACLKD